MRIGRPTLVLMLAAVATLAGCTGTGVTGLGDVEAMRANRTWIERVERTDGQTVIVAVTDRIGRIDKVEIDPGDADARPADGVSNPPGKPDVVLVPWTGGACDTRTTILIVNGAAAGTMEVRLHTQVAAGPCDDVGVPHLLRLTAVQPLPADTVTLTIRP